MNECLKCLKKIFFILSKKLINNLKAATPSYSNSNSKSKIKEK